MDFCSEFKCRTSINISHRLAELSVDTEVPCSFQEIELDAEYEAALEVQKRLREQILLRNGVTAPDAGNSTTARTRNVSRLVSIIRFISCRFLLH